MEKYTVEAAIPTGKSDPKFGTEFHVKFAENEGTFKLWYKNPPTPGMVQEGEIDGWKFKKAKKEWNPTTPTQDSPRAETPSAPYAKKVWKDNSDGMRQGMCINNAAASLLAFPEEDDKTWADRVHARANALYALGDLGQEGEEAGEVETTAAQIFGVKPSNAG